jgi:alcohol dehydrogenase
VKQVIKHYLKKLTPPVGSGSKVLICGGATATGLFAVQLAKAVGAQVAVTSSQRNFSLFEKLGYKIVQTKEEINAAQPKQIFAIDYNTKDFGEELKGQGYDVVYDCVGGEQQWTSAQKILKQNGQFITIVGDDTTSAISLKSVASTGTSLITRKFWSVFSSDRHGYIMHFLKQTPEDLDDIRINYIETDKVKPVIDTVYDLKKDGINALYSLYEKSKSGKAQGKLVLKISDAE